ncbi:MAG: hypothetical protein IPL78_32400 [Chloroflexi bacterium]|nr:hypothetical protein [Chloroflexota bacterium]
MKNKRQRLLAGMGFGFVVGLSMGAAFQHWAWMLGFGVSMAVAFSQIFMHHEKGRGREGDSQ